MTRTGVADLKARLSHYLGLARRGEEVLITDRNRPVAKLTPLAERDTEVSPHLLEMERQGLLVIGSGQAPPDLPRPRARGGHSAVQAVLDERAEGR